MALIKNFNNAISKWLAEQGYPNIEVDYSGDFGFSRTSGNIYWAVVMNPVLDEHFRQFFYEYGLNYDEYSVFCMSLLHELGHAITFSNFTENEINEYEEVAKRNPMGDNENNIERDYWYWELDIEFAANMWAINWANTHKKEFIELHNLCEYYLNKIYSNENIVNQILQWEEDVRNGEWVGDIWIEEEEDDEEWVIVQE